MGWSYPVLPSVNQRKLTCTFFFCRGSEYAVYKRRVRMSGTSSSKSILIALEEPVTIVDALERLLLDLASS